MFLKNSAYIQLEYAKNSKYNVNIMPRRELIGMKKLGIASCAILILALSGCAAADASSMVITTEILENVAAEATASAVLTVQIQSISGDTVTAVEGTLAQSSEIPDTDRAATQTSAQAQTEAAQVIEGAAQEQQGMPEPPDSGQAGAPPQGMFTAGTEQVTFTVTQETDIQVDAMEGATAGTRDDLIEGSIAEVKLEGDLVAQKITILNSGMPGGMGGASNGDTSNGTAAHTLDADAANTAYTSETADENALRIDGATLALTDITVSKTGDSTDTERGDFYGMNAGILAQNGAQVSISGAQIETDATNGNGVFSYGEGTIVNIADSEIRTQQRNSGGIQTTGGGTTYAQNLTVETQGASSAAIRSDRGGGTVEVTGGTYTTNGTGSPAVYSTAQITVSDATLTANHSEALVIEGDNSIALINCDVTGSMDGTYAQDQNENIHNVMIYQSMSGDADIGESMFSMTGGTLTANAGDLIYVTNTSCDIRLSGVALNPANETLLCVSGNDSTRGWGTAGANGGQAVMTVSGQNMDGTIIVDEISTLDFTLQSQSAWNGAVNPSGQAGSVSVTVDATSGWTLTDDSYITAFTGELDRVDANGFHLYVDGEMVK